MAKIKNFFNKLENEYQNLAKLVPEAKPLPMQNSFKFLKLIEVKNTIDNLCDDIELSIKIHK
ncbi:TPA: hypothetical protein RTG57_001777 [Campylobacter jejuni]|nr:hypothetical protein [Campylobacter jejuni]